MGTWRILTCSSRIKHLITPLVLLPVTVWAQGVTTLTVQTNVGLGFNGAFTDSFITFEGPGVMDLSSVGGGATCTNFCLGNSLTPGSSLNPSVSLDYGEGLSGTVTVGGQQIDCQPALNCSLSAVELTALSNIKFPTNGQNFTVTVPAIIGPQPISGQGVPGFGGPGTQPLLFNLQTPPGELVLTFDFTNFPSPSYQFSGAVFSNPEPSTFGLMGAAALAGILGVVLRRRKLTALWH